MNNLHTQNMQKTIDKLERENAALRASADSARPVADAEEKASIKPMTAQRAMYFMERFKREEKLLGPNEQAACDFVIAMLESGRSAPSARTLGEEAQHSIALMMLGFHGRQNPTLDGARQVISQALQSKPMQDALAATSAPAEASGPRFTSERPDILHAIYKGVQRGDSVERVHFDVCALIKADTTAEAPSVRDAAMEEAVQLCIARAEALEEKRRAATHTSQSVRYKELRDEADWIKAAIRALQGKLEAPKGGRHG